MNGSWIESIAFTAPIEMVVWFFSLLVWWISFIAHYVVPLLYIVTFSSISVQDVEI